MPPHENIEVVKDYLKVIDFLMANQISFKNKDENGRTALFYAATKPAVEALHYKCIFLFTEAQYYLDKDNRTPLHYIGITLDKQDIHSTAGYYLRDKEAIHAFDKGNSLFVNIKDKNGMLPLQIVCMQKSGSRANYLIEINQQACAAKDDYGRAALHYAIILQE